MGLSFNEFTYAGFTDFDLNFALGYTSKQDVTCIKIGSIPILVDFEWLTDSKVRVESTDLQLGDELVFYRTVSKTQLPVDVTLDSQLTRENVETLHKHALYVMHEVFDGRFEGYTNVNISVMELVTTAVRGAIQSSGLISTYKYPVQFNWEGQDVTWPTSNMADHDVKVVVNSNPLSPQEFIITGDSGVVADFTVATDGSVTTNTYDVESGTTLRLSTVQDHQARVSVVLEGVLAEYLEFSDDFPDFAQQLEDFTCL